MNNLCFWWEAVDVPYLRKDACGIHITDTFDADESDRGMGKE